jgi:Lar family restriction alleviation protein
MSEENTLKPCPFCGECEHLLIEHMPGTELHPAYAVVCDHCGARTDYTDRDWIGAWNQRAGGVGQ